MSLEHSWFSGSKLDYRTPCTSAEGRLCNIFENLRLWNEFFWMVGLQLRELSPGQLSIVRFGGRTYNRVEEQLSDAAKLLQHLLAHHRCIASVELDDIILKGHDQPIREALHRSPSLRKLELWSQYLATSASRSFVATLPKLNQLQVLKIFDMPFDSVIIRDFSKFLSSTRSLTTLNMIYQILEEQDAVILVQGLERNTSISTLSINMSVQSSKSLFTRYLRLNQTLRTLNMASQLNTEHDLSPTIGALFHNNHLSVLNLIGFDLDYSQNELIVSMLIQNRTLRSLHMVNSLINIEASIVVPSIVEPIYFAFRREASLISLWLVALTENNTLSELTMDMLLWMELDDYKLFFLALACNSFLKKVNVPYLEDKDVADICRAVRQAGVQERVSLGKHRFWQETTAPLSECKELSCITLQRRAHFHDEPLHTTLRQLPMCSHVKSLCLNIDMEGMNDMWRSLMVQYITKTTALRELRLVFIPNDSFRTAWFDGTLLQALAKNKSIRELVIFGFLFGEIESQVLVNMLDSSRTLCDVAISPCCTDASTVSLARRLSATMSGNYTLLRIGLSCSGSCPTELFAIDDVVRRNNSLATRAAHFVKGTRHKYCGAAAELIGFNQGLVEKVQELAAVDENEAASRIKRSLKSISELDDFMRLVGVVKRSVSCHRREDGQKQIVDLNRDCWLHIRQFVKVGDILD
ncbi:hypothetical protein HPB51_029228 [Rhipicephalus microplus]|uniref:Uncharacterized protein n=1 Tax=Rhipicephalus microplus TaxID=6941 RepID=A0A9J6CV46_RHIMP|nr:hypothetical protein HPB51_029228 [Rhipicephalus microplus]